MYLDVFVSCVRGTKFYNNHPQHFSSNEEDPGEGWYKTTRQRLLSTGQRKKEEEKGNRKYICLPPVRVRLFSVLVAPLFSGEKQTTPTVFCSCFVFGPWHPLGFAVAIMKRICAQVNQAQWDDVKCRFYLSSPSPPPRPPPTHTAHRNHRPNTRKPIIKPPQNVWIRFITTCWSLIKH